MKTILAVAFLVLLAACGKTDAPPAPKADATDTHPVKNVESLPSGTIQEGAKTMNRAADLGKTMEQQKEDREKHSENK